MLSTPRRRHTRWPAWPRPRSDKLDAQLIGRGGIAMRYLRDQTKSPIGRLALARRQVVWQRCSEKPTVKHAPAKRGKSEGAGNLDKLPKL